MWIFDRSRTTYSESVEKFMIALRLEKADRVFAEIAQQFNVGLEQAKNTYATPIFHLGIGYKVQIDKYFFGKTETSPRDLNLWPIEYRYTETALLFASGEIEKETFLLMNIIRFQVLNPTLEERRFRERMDNRVLPLLLTLQTLNGLERRDPIQAYLTELELTWLYQKMDHENIEDFVSRILDYRANGILAPKSISADAFINLFDATGVVIKRTQVWVGGARCKIIVPAANRSMVVDNILANPPYFFSITWDDRWKWVHYYASLPENIERFFIPQKPFVIKLRLPEQARFESSPKSLTAPAAFVATLKEGDLVAWENSVQGLHLNVVYEIIGEPTFLMNGDANIKLLEAYRSLDPNISVSSEF